MARSKMRSQTHLDRQKVVSGSVQVLNQPLMAIHCRCIDGSCIASVVQPQEHHIGNLCAATEIRRGVDGDRRRSRRQRCHSHKRGRWRRCNRLCGKLLRSIARSVRQRAHCSQQCSYHGATCWADNVPGPALVSACTSTARVTAVARGVSPWRLIETSGVTGLS